MKSFIEAFAETAKEYAGHTAIVDRDGGRLTSYEELDGMRLKAAAKLLGMGLPAGTPVVINMGRCREYLAAYLGIQSAGLAAVTVTPEYPKARIDYIMNDCSAAFVMTEDFFDGLDGVKPEALPEVSDETPAHIAYTSGSTGNPKGVVHKVKSVARLACGGDRIFDIGERLISGAGTTFSFLASYYDAICPLCRGGEVHIISDRVRKDAAALAEYYTKHKINIGFISPQLLRNFRCESPYLRRVLAGGEMLSNIYSERYEILNVYGSTETGLFTAYSVDRKYQNTPIGKVIDDSEPVIVPAEGAGGDPSEGELCIKGTFAEEYLGLPEKTAAAFEMQPDGRVLFHTGDLVRLTESGDYVYLNRLDWMVKVNGQRVETLEIESVLKDMEGIEGAAVKAFQDEAGQNYLVAYYIPEGGIKEHEIREKLLERLPAYMMPRFFERTESFPLNQNGKLDRLSLLPPSPDKYKAKYRAPRDKNEETVCEAFTKVLGCGKVGTDDDFFSLGGDSIKVLALAAEIEKLTGCTVAPGDILASRTPAAVAEKIKGGNGTAVAASGSVPEYAPLSESQRGVYFECIEDPESTMYNIPYALKLSGRISTDRFIRAVVKASETHPALFATIGVIDGEPVMYSGEAKCRVDFEMKYSREEAVRDFVRPFDLEKGPLYRFTLCMTPDETLFLMDVHHLVFDGSSLKILMSQISAAYGGDEITPEEATVFDYSEYEKGIKDTPAYKKAREFFEERFSEVEFDPTLIPDTGAENAGKGGDIVTVCAPDSVTPGMVEDFARKCGVTESTLFLAAFAYTMSVYNGTHESDFTTVNSGRHDPSISGTVGMFVRTLPLHFDIDGDGNAVSFIRNVQDVFYRTMENDCISFGELCEKYGIMPSVSFVYQSELLSEVRIGDEYVLPEELPVNSCQEDMICMMLKTAGGYEMHTHYRSGLFSRKLMANFAGTVFTVLYGLMTSEKLSGIELVSEDTKEFLDGINRTERNYARNGSVTDVLDENIEKYADRECLRYRDRSYTYGEFGRLTANLASYIESLGIGRDDAVSVLMQRNDRAVIAAWGIVRAGAAYQPLDPAYPPERINYMTGDSGAKLLIADRDLAPLADEYKGKILYTDEMIGLPDADGFESKADPEGTIALIYTSGTTGKPKGCILENRNLHAFFKNHAETTGIGPGCMVASYASFGFDAGVMDVITTLMAGGTLCIIPDEIRLDLAQVEEFYCENGITHGFMTTQLGRMFALQTKCRTLRSFMVGGEKLVPIDPPEGFRFINGYGPCETMAYICHHVVRDSGLVQPIGKPSGNTKLYVTDGYGRLVPLGASGELCIAGWQVGRGYLNLPEKTAATYVQNPFCRGEGYERMYKSGDIVRQLPDGAVEFIGRRDGQVKVRGFRIELTEVEDVIRRYEGIKDATVAAYDAASGGKYIAAYVVSDSRIDTEALDAFIAGEKPSYMVPAVTMQIDAIPYTTNGKVNRRALPVPERNSLSEKAAPETETQKKIYDIAKEILGHEDFGVTTDLFAAGLTSISTLQFNIKLGETMGTAVKIADIKEHSTVKALAAFLGDSGNEAASFGMQEDYPVMQNQMGVLLDCQSGGDALQYNIPVLFRISGKVDTKRLRKAVCDAIDAHPYIKAVLTYADDGSVRAVRNDGAEAAAEIIRTDRLPETAELVRPFDIIGGTLYRAEIYETDEGNYFFFDVHHLVSDGTSAGIFIRDVNDAYDGKKLITEKYTGYEAALEEEKVRASESFSASESYYDALLAGCETECMPAKCPEKGASKGEGARYLSDMGELSGRIAEYCGKHNLTMNAFFNALFTFTLCRFTHSDDVCYCTVYNGRNDSRFAGAFAMLVKTLPVRGILKPDDTVLGFVSAMQAQLMDTMSNDAVSFAEISRKYGVKPDMFYNYQGSDFIFDTVAGEPAEMIVQEVSATKAPFAVETFLRGGVFQSEVTYCRDVFCEEFVRSFTDAMKAAAEGFINCEKLSEVEVMSGSEKEFFASMNKAAVPFEKVPAHAFIERMAKKAPDRPAVMTRNSKLTYKELDEKANRVADSLAKLGIAPDDIIGLILDRSELVPVAEIGIMKSGGAFLPMLPTYPDERLDYCMRDAGCRFVVTSKDILESHGDLFGSNPDCRVLIIDDLVSMGRDAAPEVSFSMDSMAYCIYTSGSTGTPKGVMIDQHSLTNFVQTAPLRETESKGSVILAMASISFDMSMTEIFFSLTQGKTVYIAAEEEIHNLDMLLSAFRDNGVDMMMMTPSFAWNLISLPEFEGAMSQLRAVVLGAEAMPPALLGKLKGLNPDMLVQNGYGPTECTQVCSVKTMEAGSEITIGGPFPNAAYYIMDDAGHLLPRYAVGELIICGEGVCRGYINLPEKNERTFTEIDGVRAYHSGDMARINRDGEAEFGGRADNQIKLRGFRVELDEVESVMQEYEGVTQCKVIVRNNGTEDFLAGFFVATRPVDIDDLAAFMKTKLTYYMVPAAMMQLDKMPMTPNGKLDKKALPEIQVARKQRKKKVPKKSLEEKITDLFCQVLSLDECYVDDNFFEIGGTSLSASKVVMQLKSAGYKVEYQDIFDYQSAEDLAGYIESVQPSLREETESQSGEGLVSQDEEIREVLKFNSLDYSEEVERKPLGDVLLTGASGFLGNHILKELLESEEGHITCIIRKGNYSDVVTRLQTTLVYYFEDDCREAFQNRITVIDGDITDDDLEEKLSGVRFDTLINCAACVKHYASDNSIEFVNVHGVENLIKLSKARDARMIQISTTSVPGAHTAETYRVNLRMPEDRLFVVDDMNNQYCQSKYQAELRMFEAVRDGMKGKVIRVGNLMGRYSDGEFQTNMRTNAFLNGLRGFVSIGKCPLSHATDPMSFSPVDCTAKAVVLLAGTNDMFTAFNAESRSRFDEMKIIEAVNRCGIKVTPVMDREYYDDFYSMMGDSEQNQKVSALLTNDRPDMHMVEADNRFTTNILYRLGFSWPFIDDDYLEKVITSLDTLDFFFMD